jgi:C1A family cysteine protease
MRFRKFVLLGFVVLGLILFGVLSAGTGAEKPDKTLQTQRLSALENLENTGKIPPVPARFKSYIVQPESFGENYGLMPEMYDYPVTQPIIRDTNLPDAWDWRDHGGVSPVWDQDYTASCWVWASLKAFEANILVDSGVYTDLAERTIFNCAPWVDDLPASERGGLPIMVAHWLSAKGATLEADDPWGPPWDECLYEELTPVFGSYGWTRLPADVETIKSFLYQYGPIQSSMYASWTEFFTYDGTYCLYRTGCTYTNHTIQIVGWDDNMQYPLGQGAWICQNSWGTDWGDNGFFYIAYNPDHSACIGHTGGVYTSYHTWPMPQMLGTLYYYDEVGPSTWVSDSGSPDPSIYWGAVIYEASQWGRLAYIETWIPDGMTGVETWIYRGFNTGNPNGPRRLLRQQPGFCVLTGGFKRFSITGRPLYVRPGDTFVVVTRIDCNTYQYPLPVEYCFDGTDCTWETAKCWESQDGQPGTWYDCGTWEYDLAIRARAFDLTRMKTKLDPDTEVVIVGREYDILWDYPFNNQWIAAKSANDELLTLEVVRYDDIDKVIGTIATGIPPLDETYHWVVDDSFYVPTPGVLEPRYCVRITSGRVIALSKPFYIRKD